MEIKKEERVSVVLRLYGDETINQYQRCVSIINRDVIQLSETPEHQDINDIEGFVRKDKLAHSPHKSEPGHILDHPEAFSQEISSPKSKIKETPGDFLKEKPQLYNFDYVYLENEPVELIVQNLNLDLKKNNCLVSVGRSEALTVKGGMIISMLKRAFDETFEVFISCAIINTKVQPLIESNREISRFEEGLSLLYSLDYFNPRKPKESLVVTTITLEKQGEKSYLQFVDISQMGKAVENLGLVLTNSEDSTEIPAKDKLIQVLSKTICSSGKVILLGNINPTIPYYTHSRNTLNFLDNIYKNRHKSKTLYTTLLLRQIERLQKTSNLASRNHEELGTQINQIKEEKHRVEEDKKMYQSMLIELQQKQVILRDDQEILYLNQQLNSLREVDILTKTEIYDLKRKNEDLEHQYLDEKNKLRQLETELFQERSLNSTYQQQVSSLSLHLKDLTHKLNESESMVNLQKKFIESLPTHMNASKAIVIDRNDIAVSPFKDSLADNKENFQELYQKCNHELETTKLELHRQKTVPDTPFESAKDMEYYNLVKGA